MTNHNLDQNDYKKDITNEKMSSELENIPDEILFKILEKRPIRSLCQISGKLHQKTTLNRNFWVKRLKEDLGITFKLDFRKEYIKYYKHQRMQSKIKQGLTDFFGLFKLLNVEGQLAIYNSVIAFFNSLYVKNAQYYHEIRDHYGYTSCEKLIRFQELVDSYNEFGDFSKSIQEDVIIPVVEKLLNKVLLSYELTTQGLVPSS